MARTEFNNLCDWFFGTFNEKSLDYDGKYGAQCKDVFSAFNDQLGNPYIFGNANQMYDGRADQWYDKIKNTASLVPQKGDIAVWDSSVGGGNGHISICTGKGNTEVFDSFDQNWPKGSPCHYQGHDYLHGFWGVLRPKGITPDVVVPPADPRDARIAELEETVRRQDGEKNRMQTDIDNLDKSKKSAEANLEATKAQINDLEREARNLSAVINTFVSDDLLQSKEIKELKEKVKLLTDQSVVLMNKKPTLKEAIEIIIEVIKSKLGVK